MKKLILILALIINLSAFSQDDKTVTLVVSGQGKTQDEAKQNALRSAIEQAFGTFISSKTEILNDSLVKDEIVSVANGNIQKFEVISEVQIPNGGYASTLKATVSVTKLTSFVESKGVVVEFKGSLFSFNINQLILNEANESKAIEEITSTTLNIISKSFYGTILPKDPFLKSGNIYTLPYEIEIHTNENINSAVKYLSDNLNKLSLTNNQVNDYVKLKKPIYEIILISPNSPIDGKFAYKNRPNVSYCPIATPNYNPSSCEFHSIYLRNELSYDLLIQFLNKSYNEVFKFKINTDNNLVLNIDEINKTNCRNDYKMNLANGLIPFASPNLKFEGEFPIIFPNSDYICNGSSVNNEGFATINKSLAKYFCNRSSSNFRKVRCIVLLIHQYQKDGLVYQLYGSSNILLSDLGKISNIKIDYLK
jgi:hypothetical protein